MIFSKKCGHGNNPKVGAFFLQHPIYQDHDSVTFAQPTLEVLSWHDELRLKSVWYNYDIVTAVPILQLIIQSNQVFYFHSCWFQVGSLIIFKLWKHDNLTQTKLDPSQLDPDQSWPESNLTHVNLTLVKLDPSQLDPSQTWPESTWPKSNLTRVNLTQVKLDPKSKLQS